MTIPLGIMASSRVEAGGSLAPDDLADLTLWLKADAITGLSDGDPVDLWLDSSSAANHAEQATGGLQPTYETGEISGLPVVRFAADYMWSSVSASSGERTIFAVVKDGVGTLIGPRADGALQWKAGTPTLLKAWVEAIVTSGSALSAGWHILTARFSDSENDATMWRDGALDVSATYTSSLTAGRPSYVGANNGGGELLTGDLAELISYDAALSTSDRQAIEAYLAAKYGL